MKIHKLGESPLRETMAVKGKLAPQFSPELDHGRWKMDRTIWAPEDRGNPETGPMARIRKPKR
eukprot:2049642-Pyramimonas_sp.AAC.1